MKTSESRVVVQEERTYDEYLHILEDAYEKYRIVPNGNIVFPIPFSHEEYEMIKEVKQKIIYYLYQQNHTYGVHIDQVVLWSLEINNEVEKLSSWEHLDCADYTLILCSDSFSKDIWSASHYDNNNINEKLKNVSPDIILYFDKNDVSHSESMTEILKFAPQKILIENDLERCCLLIPVERILGIRWKASNLV